MVHTPCLDGLFQKMSSTEGACINYLLLIIFETYLSIFWNGYLSFTMGGEPFNYNNKKVFVFQKINMYLIVFFERILPLKISIQYVVVINTSKLIFFFFRSSTPRNDIIYGVFKSTNFIRLNDSWPLFVQSSHPFQIKCVSRWYQGGQNRGGRGGARRPNNFVKIHFKKLK